ncbi:MAG: sigma-70 family RNA polymerase sigma factor [Deltaproteobacteria bacterium]|nr:sigma-70 family RNA polymerase sigma factor [Deltaproteobacteria bacterium]
MDARAWEAVEQRIRAGFDEGDFRGGVTVALQEYGPWLLGYLNVLLKTEDEAFEVFCQFSEDLWKGVAGFRWESAFRTWAYRLAYHAAMRHLRAGHRRPARNVPLSRIQELSRLQAEVRTTTRNFLRTEVKDELARLRETLSPEEQSLLTLRLDRGMSWEEIARVTLAEGDAADPAALRRQAAALRQQLCRLKTRLAAALRQGDADPRGNDPSGITHRRDGCSGPE